MESNLQFDTSDKRLSGVDIKKRMQQIRFTTEFVMSKDDANKLIQDKLARWKHPKLTDRVSEV